MAGLEISEAAARRALGWVLVATTVARLALGWVCYGFWTGDDVEILEAGFRAIGLHYVPWALRNTLLPDLCVAPAVYVVHALGAGSPRLLIWIASWPFVAAATLNVYLLYRLVLAWSPRPVLALAAAFLYGWHWLPLGLGSMTFPRTVSTSCVLAAAWLASRRPRGWWHEVLAGTAVAGAFAIRYSEGLYLPAVGLLAVAALGAAGWRRRMLALARVAVGFAAGAALLVGVYEAATLGRAFGGLIGVVRFTFVERQTTSVTALHPAWWYLWRLPHWWSPAALILAAVALCRRRLAWAWLFVVIPLLVLPAIQYKELRYLQGVIPFACALSAAGALALWDAGWRRTAAALYAAAVLWQLAGIGFLTRKSMPAVAAAQALAADPAVRTFAGVQLWAFGERLYLGDRRTLRDIPYPATAAADLDRLAAGADAVALYTADLSRQPPLGQSLARLGLCPWRTFAWHDAKAVSVFRPCTVGRPLGARQAPTPR